MSSKLNAILQKRCLEAQNTKRRREKEGLNSAPDSDKSMTSQSALLKQGELPLDFEDIIPTNEYMTAFTRIPVFIPVQNRRKYNADPEVGVVMETPFGRIKRFGAGLNIFDEDTLMGLMHCCRQGAITGRSSDISSYTSPPQQNETVVSIKNDQVITVHVGESSLYEINRYLGRGLGGSAYKETRDSINRLSRASFEAEVGKAGNAIRQTDFLFKLTYRENGGGKDLIRVIFQPLVTRLLANQLTYIDMNVRMAQTDLGKAVHRYLSSQFSNKKTIHRIGTRKLYEIVGYKGEYKAFNRSLKQTVLPKLIKLGWLKSGSIDKSASSKELILTVVRKVPGASNDDSRS